MSKTSAPDPAYQEGDGLLPGSSSPPAPRREPRWLPWVMLGGGLVVATGIVYTAARNRPVTRNRRRTSRR